MAVCANAACAWKHFNNANRAPVIGEITNATLYKGATLNIPISAKDIDGNPVTLTVIGLPSFATYTQTSNPGSDLATGIIRFAPFDASRGDYTLTIAAQDNGDGNINQILANAKTFVVSVLSDTEPPLISAPTNLVCSGLDTSSRARAR